MALREVLAKFGFEFDKAKLREVNSQVEQTEGLLKSAVGLLAGATLFHGIKSFVEDLEHTGSALKDLEEQTGLSAQNIQLFEYGAGLAGVKTEEWELATRKLAQSLGGAGEGAKQQNAAFAALGVHIKGADGQTRSLNEVLPDIVEGFGKIDDPSKKARLAVDLFGRSGVKLVGFLSEGKDGLDKLRQEFEELGGGFSEETIKAADAYGDNLLRLNVAATSLKSTLGNEILPVLSDIVRFIAKTIGKIREFAKGTELAKGTMIALGVAGVAGLTALLAPFAPIIAAVSALSLGLDDLINFLEGNDSLIGDALNKFLGEGGAEKVRTYLNDIGNEVANFFADLIKHPQKFFDDLAKMIDDQVNKIPLLGELNKFLGENPIVPTPGGGVMPVNKDVHPTRDLLEKIVQPTTPEQYAQLEKQVRGEVPPPPPSDDWFAKLANTLFGGGTAGIPAGFPATAPVPGQPVNQIDQQNRVNITVQHDTPEEISRAVEQGATNALGNERRAALAALDQVAR